VSPSHFDRQRRRWQRLKLRFAGGEDLDPEKETDADCAAIAAGFTTLEKVCARRNEDWRDVIRQREREQKFAAKHNVVLTYDRPAVAAVAATPAKEEEEVADDE